MADQDYTSGLTDPDALEGLPPLASPLTASGQDPDTAKLMLLSNARMGPLSQPQGPPAQNPMGNVGAAMVRAAATGQQPAPSGQRPPAPVTASAPGTPPLGAVDPRLQALGTGALQSESDTAAKQVQTAEQLGTVDPAIAQLTQKREEDAAKAPNPADYKPGFGTRFLRGMRAVGLGLATGGLPGAAVGALDPGYFGKSYGAPTDAYDQADTAYKQQEATDAQALTDAQDLFKARQDALKLQQAGLDQGAGTYGRVGTGATGAENAGTDAAKLPILAQQAAAQAQNAFDNSPEAKQQITNTEFQQRQNQADRMGLRGENRTLYVLNGKVPDPRQATADEIASAQATRIFTQEHGHPPQTLAEYQEVQAAARGGAGKSSGADANLRAAAKLAADDVKNLESTKGKLAPLDEWSADDEQRLTDARAQAAQYQAQVAAAGNQPPAKSDQPPSDRILKRTPEMGWVYGKNGEAWQRVQGKWAKAQ